MDTRTASLSRKTASSPHPHPASTLSLGCVTHAFLLIHRDSKMPTCGARTSRGKACRIPVSQNGDKCIHHKPASEDEPTCAICIQPIRTRNTRTLECGHTFHKGCLGRWKSTGNYTCPVCRQVFDPPEYRAKLTIEYLRHDRPPDTVDLDNQSATQLGRAIITADMIFELEDLRSMNEILIDMGISQADAQNIETVVQGTTDAAESSS